MKEIENRLNAQYSGIIYDDNDYENNGGDNLLIKITKTDTFRIRLQQDVVFIEAPINVWVKGRLKKTLLSLPGFTNDVGIEKYQDASFNLTIRAKSKIGIGPDWQLKTQTEGSFSWNDKPSFDIAGIKIPIGSFVESKVNDQIKAMSGKFDQEIAKSFNLKSMIEPYWRDIQTPRKVNEQYNAWLMMNPDGIGMAPIRTDKDNVYLNIGIRSVVEVVSGVQPKPGKPKALPRLKLDQPIDSSFNIFLHTTLAHTLTTKMVQDQFNGKTFEFENGKHKITLEDIGITGGGDRFIVRVKFNGKVAKGLFGQRVKGQVFFSGKPVYDSLSKTISIKDVDFDLESRNFFAKSATWIFKGKILSQLQEKLVFPVSDQLENARKLAEDALNNTSFSDKMKTYGKLNRLIPSDIQMTEDAIQMTINAMGYLGVRINKL